MKHCIDCGAPLMRAKKCEQLRLCVECVQKRGIERTEAFAVRVGLSRAGVMYQIDAGMPELSLGGLRWIPIADALAWLEQRKAEGRRRKQRAWLRQGVDLRPGVIYALRCPKTNQVRYIGKTGELKKRIGMHLRDARKPIRKNDRRPVCCWIRKLVAKGLEPKVEVLQECLPGMMNASEQEWIAQYKADGAKLLNATDGGESCAWTEEGKKRQSERCVEINRRLAKDPKWIEAQHRRFAEGAGMTVDQWREMNEQRKVERVWNVLLRKYNTLLGRVRAKVKREQSVREIRVDGDVAYVPLTQGQTAIIDANDVQWVSQFKWSAQMHNGRWRAKRTINGLGIELLQWRVARRQKDRNGFYQRVELVNHDPLDCRRQNIRICDSGTGMGTTIGRIRHNADEFTTALSA